MPRALAQLHRVLRPGGRALILDTDWRSIVWHASDTARMERVLACWDDHLADPHLPATLGPMLTRAGFASLRVEIVPMLSPVWQPVSYAAGIMKSIHGFVRANGARHGLARSEIQAWYDDQLRLIERGEFFFSLNRYAFLARALGVDRARRIAVAVAMRDQAQIAIVRGQRALPQRIPAFEGGRIERADPVHQTPALLHDFDAPSDVAAVSPCAAARHRANAQRPRRRRLRCRASRRFLR